MDEHDKLEAILKKINHRPEFVTFLPGHYEPECIIFKQPFIDKFLNCIAHDFVNKQQARNYINIDFAKIKSELLLNLDDPTGFIYSILFEDKLDELNKKLLTS